MSRIETWVTKMTHVNKHVDQVLRSNDSQLGGAFAKRPSVAPLPVQDRLFFWVSTGLRLPSSDGMPTAA